jgi:hypothetical protein
MESGRLLSPGLPTSRRAERCPDPHRLNSDPARRIF